MSHGKQGKTMRKHSNGLTGIYCNYYLGKGGFLVYSLVVAENTK